MKQMIDIPIGIDLVPFWANIFLYSYEEEFMSSLTSSKKVKARHVHCTQRFIDDLHVNNCWWGIRKVFFGNISKRVGVKGLALEP